MLPTPSEPRAAEAVRAALKAEREREAAAEEERHRKLPPLPKPTVFQNIFSAIFFGALTLGSTIFLAWEWSDAHYTAHRWFFPEIAYLTAALLVCYFALQLVARAYNRGVAGLFDAFWACNFCLVLCAAGIVLHLPSLLGAAVTLLAFEHLTFAIDCVWFVAFGWFPLGAAAYLSWPTAVPMDFVTTSHHAWMLPLLCTVLYRSGGIGREAWPLSVYIAFALSLVGRFCIPKEMDGWTVSPLPPPERSDTATEAARRAAAGDAQESEDLLRAERSAEEERLRREREREERLGGPALRVVRRPARHYLNINMAHEMTRDVPIALLHRFDTAPAPLYLVYLALLGNVVFNGPTFLALRALSRALLDVHDS